MSQSKTPIPSVRNYLADEAGEKCIGIESPARLPAFDDGDPTRRVALEALARCGQLVQVVRIGPLRVGSGLGLVFED